MTSLSMRTEVAKALDRIDLLPVGRGRLDGYLFGHGDLDAGQLGLGVEYAHRISNDLSAFARGTAGYQYGTARSLYYDAVLGARWRF